MAPLILGTLWTVGVMQLTKLKFNLVNVWALPLIIGSAAEYGVSIVLRSLESPEHGGGSQLARSTVMAVLFNGLTTITGFASLLVAHHRGVWSLGLLLVIGSVMTLAASLLLLPTLLRLRSPVAASTAAGAEQLLGSSTAHSRSPASVVRKVDLALPTTSFLYTTALRSSLIEQAGVYGPSGSRGYGCVIPFRRPTRRSTKFFRRTGLSGPAPRRAGGTSTVGAIAAASKRLE